MITNCVFGIFSGSEVLNESKLKVLPHQISYNRINNESSNDYSNFKFDNQASGIKKITWNEKRLNLSILLRSSGKVKLDERAEGLELNSEFSTGMWRNFTIIKNGELNVKQLPVELSSEMVTEFSKVPGLVTNLTEKGQCVLNLEVLPIMSREFIQEEVNLNGTQIAELAWMEACCKAQSKCLKYYIKQLASIEEGSPVESQFNEKQQQYLAEFCITESGEYSPKKEKSESVDETEYKEFSIKVDGFSSLGKVDEVEKKMKGDRKLNNGDAEISREIVQFHRLRTEMKNDSLIPFLKDRLFKVKEVSEGINYELQKTKFAVMLHDSVITGLDEKNSIITHGVKVTFNYSK